MFGATSALGSGASQRVGAYVFHVPSRRWQWSEEVYRIHGFAPGEVVPTTELLLAHKHPEDLGRARQVIEEVLRTGEPFSSRHRLVDALGVTRTVVVVGRGLVVDGQVVQLHGYFVDVTDALRADAKAEADAAVRAATEHRSVLDQAKGAVMLALGVGEDAAFDLLAARSQAVNVKVREVAAELVDDIACGRLANATAEAMTDWLCADVLPLAAPAVNERPELR